MMTGARATYHLDAEEDDEEPGDPREVHDGAEEEAAEREQEDAARRGRPGSSVLDRTKLVDYAQFRGVRLTRAEQSAPMDTLRKVVLDRLAELVYH